ncbi:hypothetical protein UNDYM_3850 [Undibacterium sp. YM2]|nr:hypothetical protein UNDYM_3850 [Undibacterium sp. YM2]
MSASLVSEHVLSLYVRLDLTQMTLNYTLFNALNMLHYYIQIGTFASQHKCPGNNNVAKS